MNDSASLHRPLLSSRQRRRTGGAAALLALAAWAFTGCGGGGSAEAPRQQPLDAGALSSATHAELVQQARSLLRQRYALRAAGTGWTGIDPSATLVVAGSATATTATTAAADGASPGAVSSTLVQEPGVDEPDLLKSDGRLLFALDTTSGGSTGTPTPHRLRIAQPAAGGSLTELQVLALPGDDAWPVPRGLLLPADGARVVALQEHRQPIALPQPCPPGMACLAGSLVWAPSAMRSHVGVQAIERSSAVAFGLGHRLDIEGRLVGSRRVGQIAYLLTQHSPNLAADALPSTASEAEREAAMAALSAADLLPRQRLDGGAWQPLLADGDCRLQAASRSTELTVTTLVAVDLGSPTLERRATCFLGGTEALYLTPTHLYLATTRDPEPTVLPDGRLQYPQTFSTDIHRYALNGLAMNYRASGEVSGHLGWDPQRMALRLSEHNGDLRVLSFTGSLGWDGPVLASGTPPGTPSPATLTVLRENSTTRRLDTVATLPNARRPAALGKPGEQIHGVRYDGARAYLVTFRQTDPLYVLDLSDPADPRSAGSLEMPGFSDTLLPMGDGLLFGVGRDATATGQLLGVQLTLFDVSDPAQPRIRQTLRYGARGSMTALDFSTQGLNLRRVGNTLRLALPMALRSSDFAAETDQALHRFDLDVTARSLNVRAPLASPVRSGDLWGDRSLQVGDAVFYLTQGRLLGAAW